MKAYLVELSDTVSYYIQQLWEGFAIKGWASMLLILYVDTFHGDVLLLNFYFGMMLFDLILGVLYAHVQGVFNPRYLLYWIRKLLTYTGLVGLFGIVCYASHITTGIMLNLVNWLLLICIFTELGSVLGNLKKLGCPLPAPLEIVLRLLRKNAVTYIASKLGATEEDKKELEAAIAPVKRRKVVRKKNAKLSENGGVQV